MLGNLAQGKRHVWCGGSSYPCTSDMIRELHCTSGSSNTVPVSVWWSFTTAFISVIMSVRKLNKLRYFQPSNGTSHKTSCEGQVSRKAGIKKTCRRYTTESMLRILFLNFWETLAFQIVGSSGTWQINHTYLWFEIRLCSNCLIAVSHRRRLFPSTFKGLDRRIWAAYFIHLTLVRRVINIKTY